MKHSLRIQRLGDYELGDRLGIGGMAEVFEGVHRHHGVVAMKLILPGLANDNEFAEMFLDEARITSGLDHPHIVRVLDHGQIGSQLYMALEYIDGPTLARVLRKAAKMRQPLSYSALLTVVTQLLTALSYVHEAKDEHGSALGIIHRDISPGNVMVSTSGDAKLGDFGIVRSRIVARRTQPGELKGKIGYMAPEQAMGEPVSVQSDLFSVAIILAEFLTLRPLFLGKNEMQTLTRTVEVDLSTWHRHNSHVPLGVRAVVERALRRSPDERFRSAGEMRDELLRIARAQGWVIDARNVAEELTRLELIQPEKQVSGERIKTRAKVDTVVDVVPERSPPSARRPTGRPIWNVDFSARSLPKQLFLACKRASNGAIELSAPGASLVIELRDGRVYATHDSTGHAALGRLLVQAQILTPSDLTRAIGESGRAKLRLGEYLALNGSVRKGVVDRVLGQQLAARLEPWIFRQSGRLSVFAATSARSPRDTASVPSAVAELVLAMRPAWTERHLLEALGPVWGAIVVPGDDHSLVEFGLTDPEARALSTAMEGGAYEGRSVKDIVQNVQSERIARRHEAMFALFIGLSAGLIQSPGFGH